MPSQCNEQALARLLQEAERLWSGLNSADRLDILQSCADRLGTILLGDNAEAADFWDPPDRRNRAFSRPRFGLALLVVLRSGRNTDTA